MHRNWPWDCQWLLYGNCIGYLSMVMSWVAGSPNWFKKVICHQGESVNAPCPDLTWQSHDLDLHVIQWQFVENKMVPKRSRSFYYLVAGIVTFTLLQGFIVVISDGIETKKAYLTIGFL